MLQIAGLVFPLFGLILLGYISGRLRSLPVEGLAWLNFFIVYIALPALFYRLLSQTPISEFANAAFLLRTTFGTFIIFCLSFSMARLLRRDNVKAATIQGFAGAYGNIGYLGPPLAIAAFGPEAGVPVALIFCLDNAMHFTLAPLLMTIGGKSVTRVNAIGRWWSMVRLLSGILGKILGHPFILATIAGIAGAWFQYRPPAPIDQLLHSLSNAAAPCALFAMGVSAALRPLKRIPVELSWLLPIKLVIHPLLIHALVSRIPGIDSVWLHSAVLLAALPTAANVFVIAQQYHVWEERASSAVVLSTSFSILSVTTYLYLTRVGYL
ncbi:MAG: AEC family transporter [Granulosicoccus sp.]